MPVYIRDAGIWKNVSGAASAGNTFESGTRLLFIQANAPTGWVKESDQAYNNAALRIVTGSGGGVVDGSAFTAVFASRSVPLPLHSHYGTTKNDSPNHTHSLNSGVDQYYVINDSNFGGTGADGSFRDDGPGTPNDARWYSNTGGVNNNHQHGFTTSNEGTDGASMNFAVRYVDAIICTKQ